MGSEADSQVQIARGCAADAMFTFAAHAHARPVADPGRNADVHGARMAVLFQRQALRRALIRVLERELNFVLDVAPGTLPGAAAASTAAFGRARLGPAEERREEIGERVGVAEEILHFLRRHRAEAAA